MTSNKLLLKQINELYEPIVGKLVLLEDIKRDVVALEEEWFYIIGEEDANKAYRITSTLLKELEK